MTQGRKVVQITTTAETKWTLGTVTALCDDGSLWLLAIGDEQPRDWLALPPIPQHDVTPWHPQGTPAARGVREMLVAGASCPDQGRQA